MGKAFKSTYYQDGKPYRSKKKNGIENKFDHIKLHFLELENNIHSIIAYLLNGGMDREGIKERNAYEIIYKFFSMQKGNK